MRYILCLMFVSGCVAVSMPPDDGLSADLACESARMVVQLRQEMTPTPANDKCENCDGTGKIGDGRIVVTCPVCGGSGKRTKSVCKDCTK